MERQDAAISMLLWNRSGWQPDHPARTYPAPLKKGALTQLGSMRLEVARKGRFYTLGVIRYPEFHPSKTPKPPEERFLSLQDRPCAVPGPGNPAGSGFRADGGRLWLLPMRWRPLYHLEYLFQKAWLQKGLRPPPILSIHNPQYLHKSFYLRHEVFIPDTLNNTHRAVIGFPFLVISKTIAASERHFLFDKLNVRRTNHGIRNLTIAPESAFFHAIKLPLRGQVACFFIHSWSILAPKSLASLKSEFRRSAPRRSAPQKSESQKLAPLKSAYRKLAPRRETLSSHVFLA